MPTDDQRLQRSAEGLAEQLRRIPKQHPARQQKHLRDALRKQPELVLRREIHFWLQFGDLKEAVEKIGDDQMRAAGAAVSSWLHDNDRRLNPEAPDVHAPVDDLPPEIHHYLSVEALSILGWPSFMRTMKTRDISAWAGPLEHRLDTGRPIDEAEILISVLRAHRHFARRIGPLAFARAAAANLADPALRDEALADLASSWPELSALSAAQIAPLAASMETVDLETQLKVELPPPLRVMGLWRHIRDDAGTIWPKLDYETRIMAIYRAADEQVDLDISMLDEPHGLALAATFLYSAEPGDRTVVDAADSAASKVVIEHGWVDPDPPNLKVLLPHCRVDDSPVEYCEGKLSSTSVDVWCPRLRKYCDQSHASPEPERPWWRWSLLELSNARSLRWRRSSSTTWPNDLAGWVNRWHDIRERLRCSTCGSVMEPNYRYSRKATAAYGKTVMSCPTGLPGHDRDVYLNHCNRCGDPIDSRECKQRLDGFYLCLRCGSGPASLAPGAMCPACGSANTERSSTSRWVTCSDCNYKVHTR